MRVNPHLYDLDLGQNRLQHSGFHIVPQRALDEVQAISGQPCLLWLCLCCVVVRSQLGYLQQTATVP